MGETQEGEVREEGARRRWGGGGDVAGGRKVKREDR